MTLPLAGADGDGRGTSAAVAANGARTARSRRRRKGEPDPEAAAATVPAAPAVAPRAMEGFELPPLQLLAHSPASTPRHTDRPRRSCANSPASSCNTLATFDIPAEVVGWTPGPTVTLFRVKIARA